MTTQEVDLPLSPVEVVERLGGLPGVFALDGGTTASWACGHALIGMRPRAILRVFGDGRAAVDPPLDEANWQGDPLGLLERFRCETQPRRQDEPLAGGLLVALSYDLRNWIEPWRGRRPAPEATVLYAARYDALLSYDYRSRRYDWRSVADTSAAGDIAEIASRAADLRPVPDLEAPSSIRSGSSRAEYQSAVRAALDYIGAGDIYQVNLSQCLSADVRISPAALYGSLQRRHPMPFSAYVDCGESTLVSNSPECFLVWDGGVLSTYPIKGTRGRSADAAIDSRLAAELQSDPKELAEHVMIVDLERNDLGRVCKTASVRVEDLARLHSFPTLHHLVSKVSGEAAAGVSMADVLRATFPGGSITGAPKIRAMEIIDEIEPVPRGFYTGSIGFIDDCGRATFNIAIRTAVVTPERVTYHAGGGIVADSNPEREYEETLLKAQPFLGALHAKAA